MNILVVDDQNLVLQGLTTLVRLEIPEATVSSANSGAAAIKKISSERPDVVLLDVNMPVMNGLEIAKYITTNYPLIKIIMLTHIAGKAMVLSLVKIAHGFLFKDVEAEELKKVIYTVLSGEKCFCSVSKTMILNNTNEMDKLPYIHLEKHEIALIKMMSEGRTSKDIGVIQNKKEKAINRCREELLKKTKTKNTSELIAFAFHNGLV